MIKLRIKYKSVLEGIINIEERNTLFNSLDPQSQRMEIAWDALQLVMARKIAGKGGNFWGGGLKEIKAKTAKEFQLKLINELPNCEVCARGALMLGQIRVGNCISPRNEDRNKGNRHILKGFDYYNFKNIEREFEWNNFCHPFNAGTTKKLANILCNILVNGYFNTEDKTKYID